MRDVAALAGVSFKTVSRVVNAEAGVSSALRERVQAAAEQLHYRHNLAASNLRRTAPRTLTVGALIQLKILIQILFICTICMAILSI